MKEDVDKYLRQGMSYDEAIQKAAKDQAILKIAEAGSALINIYIKDAKEHKYSNIPEELLPSVLVVVEALSENNWEMTGEVSEKVWDFILLAQKTRYWPE